MKTLIILSQSISFESIFSCFAKLDKSKRGRFYLGITTAGRSAKFMEQAVAASLLQSGKLKNIDET